MERIILIVTRGVHGIVWYDIWGILIPYRTLQYSKTNTAYHTICFGTWWFLCGMVRYGSDAVPVFLNSQSFT